MWRVDDNGIPDTGHLILIDDEVSSGGTGNIPGAVDFFHSAMFNNAGTVVNWVDESFAPTTGSDESPDDGLGGEGLAPGRDPQDRPDVLL